MYTYNGNEVRIGSDLINAAKIFSRVAPDRSRFGSKLGIVKRRGPQSFDDSM